MRLEVVVGRSYIAEVVAGDIEITEEVLSFVLCAILAWYSRTILRPML